MTLYLLRHCDAVVRTGDDVNRTLTERGEEQAKVVGRALLNMNISLDVIISSPYARAQQTASLVKEIIPVRDYKISNNLIPGTHPQLVISEINDFYRNRVVMLIGHEPQLRIFMAILPRNLSFPGPGLKTGSLGCISLPHPIVFGQGTLEWVLTNEEMENNNTKFLEKKGKKV